MNTFKLVFGISIFILFGMVQAYAVDPSICESGSNMVLYPNGLLKSCMLKDYFNSNTIKCNKGQLISFYADGKLEMCILAEPSAVSGQKCKQSEPISFYADGKFKSCVKAD